MRATLISLLALALAMPSGRAAAQVPLLPLGGESPLTGVRLHTPAVAGMDDAAAIEVNPAGLAFLPAWSLRVHHSEMREEGRMAGTGSALFAAAPLPFYRKLVLATGLSWLRPADSMGYAESVKLSFAAAIRPRPWLTLGLSLHTAIADKDDDIDGLTALDLGLAARPLEWIGVGLVVRNLNTPIFAGLPLSRIYDLEVALRPLATRRLELGLGFALDERRRTLDPHARLAVEPLGGLRLFINGELLRRDFDRSGDRTTDVRITAGLAFDFERMSFAVSGHLGRALDATERGPLAESDARSAFQGVGLSVALRGQRRAPLVEGRSKLVALRLKKGLSTRKLLGIIGVLRAVEKRPDIAGVMLHMDGFGVGWAQAQELRAWIKRLRKAKKRVYAFLQAASSREYYIAAAADKVFLDPAGGIRLAGLSSGRIYFRGLFDKIGAKPQFIRIAEYKSAPESYTEKGPTAPALKVQRANLDDLYGQLVADLAKDRGVTTKQLRAIIDQGPFVPPKARSAGLVDELIEPAKVSRRAAALANARILPASKLPRVSSRWPVGPQIAVIAIEGDIVRGKSSTVPLLGRKVVGDETIRRALRWAGGSRRVRAVVLRIDSPGGSAMASDAMWRSVRALAKRKPVIVSMGNVAASGGYYAAAGGHAIYAMPATITGSIGIFSGKFDLSALLAKVGITIHREERGKRASMESFSRPYSEQEQRFILSRLRYYYDRFIDAVGQGRKLKKDAVDKVARGRVWTGAQARARKLVDRHGGLTEALEEAKRRAGLGSRPVRLVVLPKVKSSWLKVASRLLKAEAETSGGTEATPPPLPAGVEADVASSVSPLPTPLRELVRSIPPVFFRAKSGAPLARLRYLF